MRSLFAATLVLLLGAGVAVAESTTGTVETVDLNAKTVVVNGQPCMLEGQASGLKIDEIKVGEKVTLEYDVNTSNVSEITHAK